MFYPGWLPSDQIRYVFLPFTAVSLPPMLRNRPLKTPHYAVALAVVTLALAPASNPCQAGQVTYGFTEGSTAPNPGEIGATITISSPPASTTASWSIDASHSTDILDLRIIDSALFSGGFVGETQTPSVLTTIVSLTGAFIDQGSVMIDNHHGLAFSTSLTGFVLNDQTSVQVTGSWTPLAAVPEPASSVQAGIASAIGLALAAFRKLKEARRQRPVGPLDANQ